jgi:transposase
MGHSAAQSHAPGSVGSAVIDPRSARAAPYPHGAARSSHYVKHRIHSALDRYGVFCFGVSNLFGVHGHLILCEAARQLPPYTAEMLLEQLDSFDALGEHRVEIEARIEEVIAPDPLVRRLTTLPGVRKVLAPVITLKNR